MIFSPASLTSTNMVEGILQIDQHRTGLVVIVVLDGGNKEVTVSKYRLLFTLGFATVLSSLIWLVLGDSSPLAEYFLYHVSLPNLLRHLLVVPYLVLMTAKPNTQTGDATLLIILEFAQWCVVGYLLSRLIFRK
jgi:hypothetical protein